MQLETSSPSAQCTNCSPSLLLVTWKSAVAARNLGRALFVQQKGETGVKIGRTFAVNLRFEQQICSDHIIGASRGGASAARVRQSVFWMATGNRTRCQERAVGGRARRRRRIIVNEADNFRKAEVCVYSGFIYGIIWKRPFDVSAA